jgi:N-acetylglucosaminyldiphosphoundecaprenol N-acetyl-beta-D-mannosaminyltransferase
MEVAPMAAEMAALRPIDGLAGRGGGMTSDVASERAGRGSVGGRRRVSLNGSLIDQVDFADAVARIRGFLTAGREHQVVTVNLDFLSIAERDPHFRDTINRADLAVADGMPVVWASRLTETPLPQRIAGVDLVDACCELAAEVAGGIFLLGAAPGVAEEAAQRMKDLYPGLQIAGTYSPPFGELTPQENERIVERIRAARPTFLFVALGAPRQDQWIRAHLGQLGVPVSMGVGCVLDLLAGNVSRAPQWMQRSGLEWAYRLGQEPGRLWRRYILDDFPTLGRVVLRSVRDRRTGLA